MFGLMKNTGCTQTEQQDWYRKHYCGTCKSMGSLYGQRSRMLLNFDCVFLAELLSVIQEVDTKQWDPKLTARNCFSAPETDSLPISLQYAADINLIFAEMKVRDNMQDGVQFVWKMAQRFLTKPFSRVHDRLAGWGIDRQLLLDYQDEDTRRETNIPVTDKISDLLDWYAAPSAAITGYLFAKGADAVQKPAWREDMAKIGAAFGELVYGLDAWKDVEQDEEEGSFNLLLLHPERSQEDAKQQTADWLWEKAESIQELIRQAHFPEDVKASLNSRLMLNLSANLGASPHVCTPHSGIEKATVPTLARTIGRVRQGVAAWTNPLKPARFAATYIAFLLVVFHEQLFAAADRGAAESVSIDYTLLGVLVAAPIGIYIAAKGISKHRLWIALKLKREQKRLKRRLRKAERKPGEKEGKNTKRKEVLNYLLFTGILILLSVIIALLIPENSGCDKCMDNCNDSRDCINCCCEIIACCGS